MYFKMLRDGLEGAAKYSMASRHYLKENERSPGPAAYLPTMWAMPNRPPEYTFGMKHRYDKSFITPGICDSRCFCPFRIYLRKNDRTMVVHCHAL